jgi:hypothetical protein
MWKPISNLAVIIPRHAVSLLGREYNLGSLTNIGELFHQTAELTIVAKNM